MAKVIGRSNESLWVGVGSEEMLNSVWDEVFFTVEVKSNEQYVNLSGFGEAVSRRIMEATRKNGEGAGERDWVMKVHEVVGSMDAVKVGLVVIAKKAEEVIMIANNGGGVSLFRAGKFGKVLDAQNDLTWVKGRVVDGDVAILGNRAFYDAVEYSKLKAILAMEMDTFESKVNVIAERLMVEVERIGTPGVVSLVVGVEMSGTGMERADVKGVGEASLEKVKRVFGGWAIRKLGERLKRREKKVFIHGNTGKRRVGNLIVGITVVLLVSLGWGVRSRQIAQRTREFEELTAPIINIIEEVNREKTVSRAKARSILATGLEKLEVVKAQGGQSNQEKEELFSLAERLDQLLVEVSGEVKIDPGVYLDLELVREGFLGDKMGLVGDDVYVVDSNKLLVIKVGTVNKTADVVVSGEELRGAKMFSGDEEYGYVWGDQGVVRLEVGKASKLFDDEDGWEDVRALGAFLGRVYVLDGGTGELWRCKEVEGGEWVTQRWLAPGVAPDFSQVTDMVVDGNIWVLDRDGGVREYEGGASSGFGLSNIEVGVDACCLVVGEEEVGVLDRKGQRLLVYDKTGEYVKQLLWEQFGVASDAVIRAGKVLVLVGSKIFEVDVR